MRHDRHVKHAVEYRDDKGEIRRAVYDTEKATELFAVPVPEIRPPSLTPGDDVKITATYYLSIQGNFFYTRRTELETEMFGGPVSLAEIFNQAQTLAEIPAVVQKILDGQFEDA